jgi:uncharacterized membrane protein YczE
LKKNKIKYYFFSLLQINIFLVFLDHFDVLMSKYFFFKKNIILIHLRVKSTLKSNRNYTPKHALLLILPPTTQSAIILAVTCHVSALCFYLDYKLIFNIKKNTLVFWMYFFTDRTLIYFLTRKKLKYFECIFWLNENFKLNI